MARKGSILVVDDESVTRELTAELLEMWGYAVSQASSGEEALAMLSSGLHPDLVITDYSMPPGMFGDDVVRAVKADYPGIPVVLASSIHPGALQDLAQAVGASDYLPKPFRNEDFRQLVELLISKPK